MNRKGFTLLELLIVVGILAVLATVAVLVINPAEYLRQSRDTKRIADIAALNKALGLAEFNGLNMGGASTTVFISLVNAAADCAGLSLPALPTGYQYRCVTTAADLKKTNGTGWVPVNLELITGGSPLATLPVDPANNPSNFYTYIPGGSFALSAILESDKYIKQKGVNDGGVNPAKIEMGSDLKLITNAEGLVGYWSFDEGSGTVVNDMSGKGNIGTWNGVLGSQWGAGKIGGFSGQFDGATNYLSTAFSESLSAGSVALWVKPSQLTGGYMFDSGTIYARINPTGGTVLYGMHSGANSVPYTFAQAGQWKYAVFTWGNNNVKTYIDGIAVNDSSINGVNLTSPLRFGWGDIGYFAGAIDDIRVYNRELSASEIKVLYDATK